MGAAVVKVMLSLWKLCCTKTIKSETNSIGMALIEIPAGKFTMGSPWGEENRFDGLASDWNKGETADLKLLPRKI